MFQTRQGVGPWIAILAIVLNALWPLLAQAKPGDPPALHEVCTVDGVQKVAFEDGLPDNRATHGKASPHCAFCSFGHEGFTIGHPPHAWIAAVLAAQGSLPAYSFLPPSGAVSLRAAQPRAPPAFS